MKFIDLEKLNNEETKILEILKREENSNKFLLNSEENFYFEGFVCIVTQFYEVD